MARKDTQPRRLENGEWQQGLLGGTPDVRMLIGYCVFGSLDAALLVPLLSQLVHVRGVQRFPLLVELLSEESRERWPARDVILARLLELMLIEALRSTTGTSASPSHLRGVADEELAAVIRRIHDGPTKVWTVAELAKIAGLSRSTSFERVERTVGLASMEYALGSRMEFAKDLLRRKKVTDSEVAAQIGYRSASTFSVAFTRFVGIPPIAYARKDAA